MTAFLFLVGFAFAITPQKFLQDGAPKLALSVAYQHLANNPDSSENHIFAGIALCRIGRYADALSHFDFGIGDKRHDIKRVEYQAMALRAIGKGEQAAQLRQELLFDPRVKVAIQVRLRGDIIDDYRVAGMYDKAFAEAYTFIGKHPRSALANALLAELYLDTGELEQAAFFIWKAEQLRFNLRTERAAGRLSMLKGDVETAYHTFRLIQRSLRTNDNLAFYLEAMRQYEGPQKAYDFISLPRFRSNEAPLVLIVKHRIYNELGKKQELNMLRQRMLSLYSKNKMVMAEYSQLL